MNSKITMTATLVVLVLAAGGAAVATAQSDNASGAAAGNPPLDRQNGKITFDTGTKEVGAAPEMYHVKSGHELELTLDLEVTGGGDAVFAIPPVEFPKGDPPDFRWRPVSGTKAQVVLYELNDNTSNEPKEYFFKARVKYDGEVYRSPDPTVINEPPG